MKIVIVLIIYTIVTCHSVTGHSENGIGGSEQNVVPLMDGGIPIFQNKSDIKLNKEDLAICKKVIYTISSDRYCYAPCEPIIICATFENISKEKHYYTSTNKPLWDIKPTVTGSNNEKVPYTKFGKAVFTDLELMVFDNFNYQPHLSPLYPNEMKRGKLLINRVYDFTKIGTYKIQLQRMFMDKEKSAYCKVLSNVLEIEISEQKAKLPTIHYDDEILIFE